MIEPNTAPRQARLKLIHVIVIALSLLMTITAWKFAQNQAETRTSMRFAAQRDQVVGLITERMQQYEHLLWTGAAAVESHGGDVSTEAWRTFGRNLRIDEVYPGINGIAVVHHLSKGDVPDYLAERKRERPNFTIRPEHTEDIHLPVTFIEPEARNIKALGFDLANEKNRLEGAMASRDSGEARITAPITLVQDAGRTPGFLLYVPFYRDERSGTLEERRENIIGFVNTAFVAKNMMKGLLAEDLRGVRFSIHDNGQRIYDEHATDDALNDPDPMFAETVSLDLYGRTWTLDIRSNMAFRQQNSDAQPTLILLGGLLIEILIITLLVMMAKANRNAVAYANEVTVALHEESRKLREANEELSLSNKELEQFAYVTSHDLKTPVRGISGLTEMLEEDLEEYLDSPRANESIAKNLGRIRERVQRMNDLTSGIMEFSRTGTAQSGIGTVFMPDLMRSLSHDFNLSDGQLELRGDVLTVEADPFNFQRVVENLVGNAVKHHPDVDQAQITVSVSNDGDALNVVGRDNGSGIAIEDRDRIFEMFRTTGSTGLSTGTGIGLAIVQKAVACHGGTIAVESNEGGGAVFRFGWPRHCVTSNDTRKAA